MKPNRVTNSQKEGFRNVVKIFRKVIFLFIAISILGTGLLQSQTLISRNILDYPDGTVFPGSFPGSIILPAAHLKTSTTYTIPLLVTAPYTITMSSIYGDCDDITNNQLVTNIDNVVTIVVNKKCAGSEDNYLNFRFNISKSGYTPEWQVFKVPILRDSVKVVLTLDISGSMHLDVQGGTTTRIVALKNAVNILVPNLESFQQEGDSLGLTYYSSIVYQPSTTYFPKNFVKITSTDEVTPSNYASYKVQNDLSPRVPLQMTAMAKGLLNAKSKLLKQKEKTPNTRRMVFLFTDGLQNYGPQVDVNGNSITSGMDSLNNRSIFPKDSIRYYTIATWEAGLAPEILDSIATNSGGEALHVVQTSPTLDEWFSVQLCNMLADGSPQIVMRKAFNSITGTSSYSFNLNQNVPRVVVEFLGITSDDVRLTVKKDGVDLTSKTKYRYGERFKFLTFDFPINASPNIASGGNWEITIVGNTQNAHNLIVLADDHLFKYKCDLDKSIYTVGDTIHFYTKLAYVDSLLSGTTNSVKAILLKPGDDIGQLLSTYPTPPIDSTVDMSSGTVYKFQELMAHDTSFYNALLPSEQSIELTNVGNGVYRGSYSNTALAGIYNVIFLINGELSGVGKFERTTMVSSVFKFGQVVEEQPVTVDSIPPATTSNTGSTNSGSATTGTSHHHKGDHILKIKPKNKFGYPMGPGFASTIKVVINPGKKKENTVTQKRSSSEPFVREIVDNLDGCYYIVIANLPSGSNPDIRISVRGEVSYQGKICPIPYWIYILLGIIILLVLLLRFFKTKNSSIYNVILWILAMLVLLIIVLQYFGVFRLFC